MEDNNIQATVSDSNPVKKKRGGARPGAGRKKTTHKEYMIYASKEVSEILDSLEGIPSHEIWLYYNSTHTEFPQTNT